MYINEETIGTMAAVGRELQEIILDFIEDSLCITKEQKDEFSRKNFLGLYYGTSSIQVVYIIRDKPELIYISRNTIEKLLSFKKDNARWS